MLRRRVLPACLLAIAISPWASAAVGTERPNILLVFTDDQGIHDVGCYGSEIPTPHIDSLARDGMKFTQWYSASSICTPSRFGLLTGHNPCRSKDRLLGALMFLGEEDKHRGLHVGETTVADQLRGVGYRTALIGKWHLGHGGSHFLPTRHGFDSFFGHTGGCVDFYTMRYGNAPDWYRQEELIDVTGYATDVITDEAVRFLEQQPRSTPFFLYLAYNAPHFGKGWNDGAKTTVNQLQPPPQDLARVASIKDITRRKYAAKVVNLDTAIGRVLDTLKATGREENTLVVFLSDHGGDPVYGGSNTPYRGNKATLFEGGILVPCLIRWPRAVPKGVTSQQRVWSIDLPATLRAACGMDPIASDGNNLLPLLRGESLDLKDREMYWELGSHQELRRGRWQSLRHGPWKLLVDHQGQEFLFDISRDPHEKNNLRGSHQTEFARLKTRADVLSEEYRARP